MSVSSTVTPFFNDNTDGISSSIHSEALSTKDGNPALILKWSNSTTLIRTALHYSFFLHPTLTCHH